MVGSGAGSSRMSKPKPEPAQKLPQHSAELQHTTSRGGRERERKKKRNKNKRERHGSRGSEREREGRRERESETGCVSVPVCVAVLHFHKTRCRGLNKIRTSSSGAYYSIIIRRSPQNSIGFYVKPVKQLPFSPLSCPCSEDPAEHLKKICCAREFKCSTRAVTDSNAHSARKASTRTTSLI